MGPYLSEYEFRSKTSMPHPERRALLVFFCFFFVAAYHFL